MDKYHVTVFYQIRFKIFISVYNIMSFYILMLGIVDGTQRSTTKAAQHVSVYTVDKGYLLDDEGVVVRLI